LCSPASSTPRIVHSKPASEKAKEYRYTFQECIIWKRINRKITQISKLNVAFASKFVKIGWNHRGSLLLIRKWVFACQLSGMWKWAKSNRKSMIEGESHVTCLGKNGELKTEKLVLTFLHQRPANRKTHFEIATNGESGFSNWFSVISQASRHSARDCWLTFRNPPWRWQLMWIFRSKKEEDVLDEFVHGIASIAVRLVRRSLVNKKWFRRLQLLPLKRQP
jgi:hypothetical protein